jgi:hypothetical protein
MSIILVLFRTMALFVTPTAVELSIWMGLHGCGHPMSMRVSWWGTILQGTMKSEASSGLAAKAMTNLMTRLGISIFGSDFWDPHPRRNSDSVYNSGDSGWIFFLKFQFLESQKIGIPICDFQNSSSFLHRNSVHLFVANLY